MSEPRYKTGVHRAHVPQSNQNCDRWEVVDFGHGPLMVRCTQLGRHTQHICEVWFLDEKEQIETPRPTKYKFPESVRVDASPADVNSWQAASGRDTEDSMDRPSNRAVRCFCGQWTLLTSDAARQDEDDKSMWHRVDRCSRGASSYPEQSQGDIEAVKNYIHNGQREPLLGLATTEQLMRELISRLEMTQYMTTAPGPRTGVAKNISAALILAEMLGGMDTPTREYSSIIY